MTSMKWISEHAETINIGSGEKICANCKHFVQHYVYMGYKPVAISRGHCIKPRIKDRNISNSCALFEKKDGDR